MVESNLRFHSPPKGALCNNEIVLRNHGFGNSHLKTELLKLGFTECFRVVLCHLKVITKVGTCIFVVVVKEEEFLLQK